jgi:hypothetical protein
MAKGMISHYEKLLEEYERIANKLNRLSLEIDLSETDKRKLSMTMQKRLRMLLPEIRKKENDV